MAFTASVFFLSAFSSSFEKPAFFYFIFFFLFLNVPNTFIALGLSFAAICNSQIIRS